MVESNAAHGLRERKKTRMRATMVTEALRLFAERGFDETTVDDIAEAAEVSRRTFFRYFNRKEDVLLGWMDEVGAAFAAEVASRPRSESPLEAIRRSALVLVEDYRDRAADALRGLELLTGTPTIRARECEKYADWERAIARELRGRLGTSATARRRAHVLASVGVSAVTATIAIWRSEAGRPDLATLIDDAFRIVADET